MMIDAILSTIENEEQRNELVDLYEKYKNSLYAIALSNLHNETDAEDAVMEVFSEIADKPDVFFGVLPEKRPAYLKSMVKRISVNMFNSQIKKPKVSIEELDEEIENISVSLENAIFDNIAYDEIIAFINQLPNRQRDVIIFHCLYDLSINETAQKLKISINTVNKHLMLARKAIKVFVNERRNDL